MRHMKQRIEEHERSGQHRECADAYLFWISKRDIRCLFSEQQMSARREQIKQRRQVMERVIDIVKVIGKRGLSYRGGGTSEAAYSLEDATRDHGTFLELVLLLSKFDTCLQKHVHACIEASKQLHGSGTVRGRGSYVTFLSKTTVNTVIEVIGRLIQDHVVTEVKEAGMFSIQLDTTQDISSYDQCSIIIRYVTDTIHEKLLAVVKCKASTGHYFADLTKNLLSKMGIDIRQCAGNATDGAANMQGEYRGFSALLSDHAPGQVHVWCYAHILNLVLADTTGVVIESASLFSLLNDIAVFLRESHQRMGVWEKVADTHLKRLTVIGQTRWWAKDVALTKIFGAFGVPGNCAYISLILTLSAITENPHMASPVRTKAKGYMDSLLKYVTILTAQIFLRIFEQTSPLSKYLQTTGMNLVTAHRLVTGTQENLRKYARDFESVQRSADAFVAWANDKLQNENCEAVVEDALPWKRPIKKKRMFDEMAEDDTIADGNTNYKNKVHNVILDTVIESISRRFEKNGKLYAELCLLDPRSFGEIQCKGIHASQLQELSKQLIRYDSSATTEALKEELESLASHWDRLKLSVLEEYMVRTSTEDDDDDGHGQDQEKGEWEVLTKTCTSCKNCAVYCYHILSRYNLLTDAYHLFGLGYKFLLTLSVTQVACERSFSTLKFIKNRLRSTTAQEHLEAFMLMANEKDILKALDTDGIIDKVAEKS